MAVDLNSFICKQPFFVHTKLFRKSFANSMVIFRGTHVEQQLLLHEDSFTTCQIAQNYHK